ncbi:hypothetical protein HY025_05505 [Candidatus Daviesbacteria bacterium]|nr:hypothetical protein [Candidatus Daviesbacteria bacterium]
MIKKIIGLLALIVFLVTPSSALAVGATLSLNPSSSTVNKGCSFSVGIDLDTGGNNTDGTDVILKFDPTILTAGAITQGSVYPDYPGKSTDNSAGTVTISGLASVTTPFNGSGRFADVSFTVNPNASQSVAQINFDFDPSNKTNSRDSNVVQSVNVVDILNSVTNGSYTIASGACSTTATSTPTPTPVPGGGGVIGASTPTPTPFGFINGVPKGGLIASGSGNNNTLPPAGVSGPTLALSIVGVFLVIGGILGLALL